MFLLNGLTNEQLVAGRTLVVVWGQNNEQNVESRKQPTGWNKTQT